MSNVIHLATYCIGSDQYPGTLILSDSGKRATFTPRGRTEGKRLYIDKDGLWREIGSKRRAGYVKIGQADSYLDPHF